MILKIVALLLSLTQPRPQALSYSHLLKKEKREPGGNLVIELLLFPIADFEREVKRRREEMKYKVNLLM